MEQHHKSDGLYNVYRGGHPQLEEGPSQYTTDHQNHRIHRTITGKNGDKSDQIHQSLSEKPESAAEPNPPDVSCMLSGPEWRHSPEEEEAAVFRMTWCGWRRDAGRLGWLTAGWHQQMNLNWRHSVSVCLSRTTVRTTGKLRRTYSYLKSSSKWAQTYLRNNIL